MYPILHAILQSSRQRIGVRTATISKWTCSFPVTELSIQYVDFIKIPALVQNVRFWEIQPRTLLEREKLSCQYPKKQSWKRHLSAFQALKRLRFGGPLPPTFQNSWSVWIKSHLLQTQVDEKLNISADIHPGWWGGRFNSLTNDSPERKCQVGDFLPLGFLSWSPYPPPHTQILAYLNFRRVTMQKGRS